MTTAKFWILYLTLASPKTGTIVLQNGLSDLAIYGVEDSCDNRILLERFLPEDTDKEEIMADSFLLEKWQEHMMHDVDGRDVDEYESVQQQPEEEERDKGNCQMILLGLDTQEAAEPQMACSTDHKRNYDELMMLKEVSNLAEFADKAADLNKSMVVDHPNNIENPFACTNKFN